MGDRISSEFSDNLSNVRNEGLSRETAGQMFSKESPLWNSQQPEGRKQNVENTRTLVQQGLCPELSLENFSVKALAEGARNAVNSAVEAANHRTKGWNPDTEGKPVEPPERDQKPPINEHVNPKPPNEHVNPNPPGERPGEEQPFIHPPNHPPNSHENPGTEHRHEGHPPGVEEDERNEFRPTRTQHVDPLTRQDR